ncbi:MAG: hypothetical protein RL701_3880 [Pseudomonadota bacterium]
MRAELEQAPAANAGVRWHARAGRWVAVVGAALTASPTHCLAIAFLLAQTIWTFHAIAPMRVYSDEFHHTPQIQQFCAGHYTISRSLPMLPGYHALNAAAASVTHDCSLRGMRRFSAACALLTTLTAFLILTHFKSQYALSRALSFHFIPFLFPYAFIVYTDVTALLFGLLVVWLTCKERWVLAGSVGSLGILVRQTNLVMLGFTLFMALRPVDLEASLRQNVLDYFKRSATSLAGIAGFAVFAVLNHGVTLGNAAAFHQPGLHVANVYFTLGLLACTSLPVVWSTLWRRQTLLLSTGFLTALLAAFVLYMRSFAVTHPWNITPQHFVRNAILAWATASYLSKMLFFIPIALGFALVASTKLVKPSLWLWVPLSCALLLPQSLIEQRYSLLPIALWSLFRKDTTPGAEALSVVTNAIAAVFLLLWIDKYALWF